MKRSNPWDGETRQRKWRDFQSMHDSKIWGDTLKLNRTRTTFSLLSIALAVCLAGCDRGAKAAAPTPQALPVKVETVALNQVPSSDSYVATIKSRRSATIQPQVNGNLTQIFVTSGQFVSAGQRLMEIDPRQQQAIVAQQEATEQQLLATYEYNEKDIVRQKALYASGIISKQAYQQASQTYSSSKASYDSQVGARKSAQQQLAYFHITAPFAGVIGDVPVHIGDYVTPTTMLTTLDDNTQLEAYIFIPADRASQVHIGLPVNITDASGNILDRTKIYFVSPQVDNTLQAILAKAKIHTRPEVLRNLQLVRASIIWSSAPTPTVPVLAVSQVGGQPFVFVATDENGHYIAQQKAVNLGQTVGNLYAIKSGLQTGDKVIVSGLQFLVNGAPVKPME